MASIKQAHHAPLFDTLEYIKLQQFPNNITLPFAQNDFQIMQSFLLQYTGSQDTFNTYSGPTKPDQLKV